MTQQFLGVHAHTIPCQMGGGWIVPITLEGFDVLQTFFGEPAEYLCPIGKTGWVVEPYAVTDLAEYIREI